MTFEIRHGQRVRAIEGIREIETGDCGEVVARWVMPLVTVRWDKDGKLRRIHRKRLEQEPSE